MTEIELIANGFVPEQRDGQEAPVFVKKQMLFQFPYAGEHMIDGEYLLKEDEAIMEVVVGGTVTFKVPRAEYQEGPWAVTSDEGRGLLNDAVGVI